MIPIEISVEEVRKLLDDQADFLFVDCREDSERQIATIDGSVHIAIRETAERQNEFEAFREKTLVIHCHHGGRSLRVTQWLRSNGFPNAQNMTGGIEKWSLDVDPAIPRY